MRPSKCHFEFWMKKVTGLTEFMLLPVQQAWGSINHLNADAHSNRFDEHEQGHHRTIVSAAFAQSFAPSVQL